MHGLNPYATVWISDQQEVEVDTNLPALIAAVAASVGVCAHGVVGGRWLGEQLGSVDMHPTRISTRLFGPSDVSAQVFGVTWHSVTAVFLVSAGTLFLTGFGALESRDLLRFIAVLFASFLVVALVQVKWRRDSVFQPIPLTFFTCMAAATTCSWLASNAI
jgi:hypothetical protein